MLRFCARGLQSLRSSKVCLDRPVSSSRLLQGSLCPHRTSGIASRGSQFVCSAKKSKKTKKASGIRVPERVVEPWVDVDRIMLLLLLVESYSRQTGKHLMEDAEISSIARDVFQAPFCLLAHDYTGEASANCTYANKAALKMLKAEWDDVVGQPSTLFDKDTLDRAFKEGAECRLLLKDLFRKNDSIGHLSGLTAKINVGDGSPIELQDIDIVNIMSPSEEPVGQLILFDKWLLEDGTEAGPGYVPQSEIPSEDQIAEAQAKVDTLANHIRDLKENQGMQNDNPTVKDAVAELLQAKEALAEMTDLVNRAAEQQTEAENA